MKFKENKVEAFIMAALTTHRPLAQLTGLDELTTLDCPSCKVRSPYLRFCETELSGWLPEGHMQCPHCRYAFRRAPNPEYAAKPWLKPTSLLPIPSVL